MYSYVLNLDSLTIHKSLTSCVKSLKSLNSEEMYANNMGAIVPLEERARQPLDLSRACVLGPGKPRKIGYLAISLRSMEKRGSSTTCGCQARGGKPLKLQGAMTRRTMGSGSERRRARGASHEGKRVTMYIHSLHHPASKCCCSREREPHFH